DERSFRSLGSELGLDPIGFYSAVAFEPQDGESSSPLPSAETIQIVQKLAHELGVEPDELVETVHRGKLLVWLPHPDAESLVKAAEATESAARAVLEGAPARFAAGRSAVLRAIGNWRTIADQAVAALEIGRAVEPSRAVHRYADVAIYHIISRNPA